MTYPPTGPGYPSPGPSGPGQPPSASSTGGGGRLADKPLPYLLSIAVLVLGIAGFLFGFAPYVKAVGFTGATATMSSFKAGLPVIGLALLLIGGLLAGVSLLAGQAQQAPAAVTSLVGFVVGLFFLFNLTEGSSLAWGGVLGLVIAFVQAALAVTLLLFTVGVLQPPARRYADYQPQPPGVPGYGQQPGYAPGFGQAPPPAQPGYGQPPAGYAAPNPYSPPQQPYAPPQQYGQQQYGQQQYGQAPQYGQQQYGQAPQYGEPQQYGESQQYGQGPSAQPSSSQSSSSAPASPATPESPAGPSSSTPTQAFGVDKPERTDD
ncbi:DUF5336 domain-containing protein [Rhodococcus triatomae]|nr:hypothetical protein G419_03018 [Rhodococcus triatomae BKS 15-14]